MRTKTDDAMTTGAQQSASSTFWPRPQQLPRKAAPRTDATLWTAAPAERGKEAEEQAEKTKAQENDDNDKLEKDKKPGPCYWAARKLAADARELARDAVRKLAEAAAGVESPPTNAERKMRTELLHDEFKKEFRRSAAAAESEEETEEQAKKRSSKNKATTVAEAWIKEAYRTGCTDEEVAEIIKKAAEDLNDARKKLEKDKKEKERDSAEDEGERISGKLAINAAAQPM